MAADLPVLVHAAGVPDPVVRGAGGAILLSGYRHRRHSTLGRRAYTLHRPCLGLPRWVMGGREGGGGTVMSYWLRRVLAFLVGPGPSISFLGPEGCFKELGGGLIGLLCGRDSES
jgi:hypothetical protein